MPSGEDNGKTEDLSVTREDGSLVVIYKGVKEMTLLPESDSQFFSRDSGNEVLFSVEGKTTTVDLGNGLKAVRHNHD